ncbi:MAG: type II toxin-antitoxin system VapB family antitoxin [Phormidesmis sp.]
MRTNIDIDDALLEEALLLTQVETKEELVDLALQELIRARKKKNLLDLAGKIQFSEGYDHKAVRATRSAID